MLNALKPSSAHAHGQPVEKRRQLYAWLAIKPLVKQLLILIGPAFEMILFKTEGEPNRNPLFHKDTQ